MILMLSVQKTIYCLKRQLFNGNNSFMKSFFTIILFLFLGLGQVVKAQNEDPDSLFEMGKEFSSKTEYIKAGDYFQKSAQLYLQKSDTAKWVEASLEYGETLVLHGRVRNGLELFLTLDKNDSQQIPNSLIIRINNNIGWAYRKQERPELAKKYYLKGLELSIEEGDSTQIGRLNNNLSYAYLETGDYEQAFSHQQEAKQIYEALDDDYRISLALNSIFLTMMDLGLYQQAEPYIRQSLAIRKELGNPDMLDVAYHNLAWNFERQGKRDSSVIYYQKSLELSRQLSNPYDITQTLNNIGSLYERSGDYESALAYYNEALEANYQTDRPVSIANNLIRLARVAIQNNDLDNAGAFYDEALDRLNQTNAPRPLTNLYLEMGNLNIHKEDYELAEHYLAEAEAISKNHHFNHLQIRVHSLRGELYNVEESRFESLEEYRKAYALSARETVTGKIGPTMNLARAYRQVRSDSAFILAEEAFSLIDSVRTNVAGLAFRSGFFREHAGFYNEVAGWQITQKNNPEKAFNLIEAAKARVLMDELAEAQQKVYENLDEATLIKKQQKAKQIDRLYSQMEQADFEEDTKPIRNELKDLEFEYQSFLNELHTSSNELHGFDYPEPVSLTKIQNLLDKHTVILEFAFTEAGLIRLVISQDDITGTYIDSIETEAAKSFFTNHVRDFRDVIINGEEVNDILEQGEVLDELLIPAFSSREKNSVTNLVIIPNGPLSFLPFEALSKSGQYLIEDYHLKYLPSASIYSYIQPPHRTTEFDLLALAGSGFDSQQSLASPSRSQASFASLPSTLLEVDSISVNFSNTKILKNEDVTEATLKSHDLSNYRFLHFATHANVDEINPFRSGLLLSKKTEVESLFGEDGHLNSREISSLKLNADLVTLSACNTGMGKQVTGEGLIGLQRSFLSAGASSVMVSLWSVFDRSTSVFMSKFYKSMLTHQAEDYGIWSQTLDWFGMYEHPMIDYKTKAIRDAKLALIDHPYYNHPVHWAPFILIGK